MGVTVFVVDGAGDLVQAFGEGGAFWKGFLGGWGLKLLLGFLVQVVLLL